MEKIAITINEVIENYTAGKYKNTDEYPKERMLPNNHIFDENLSVKENRELVEKHNQRIKEAKQAYEEKSNELLRQLREDAKNAVAYEYDLTDEQASIIESYAYQEFHSYTIDYLNSLYELGELAKKLIETVK